MHLNIGWKFLAKWFKAGLVGKFSLSHSIFNVPAITKCACNVFTLPQFTSMVSVGLVGFQSVQSVHLSLLHQEINSGRSHPFIVGAITDKTILDADGALEDLLDEARAVGRVRDKAQITDPIVGTLIRTTHPAAIRVTGEGESCIYLQSVDRLVL